MKTTNKHFRIFKTEVEKWVNFFGLYEWDLTIKHIDTENNHWADCSGSYITKIATIRLNVSWDDERPLDKESLKKFAFHEVCHLLLWDLADLAEARFLEKNEIGNKEHEIISKLVNSVFKNIK